MWIVCNIDQHLWPSSATPGRNTLYYAAFYRYWYNFQVGHLLPHFRVPHVSPGPSCLVRRWDNVQNTCIVKYCTIVLYICALCYNVLYCTPLLYAYTVPILPLPGSPALPSPVDPSSHVTSRGLIISIIDVIIIIINGFIILIDDSIIIIDVSIIWRRGVEQSSVITIVEKYWDQLCQWMLQWWSWR